MKKNNRYLIPIFILILGMTIFMEKMVVKSGDQNKTPSDTEKVDTTKTDFLGEPVEQKTESVPVQAAAAKPPRDLKILDVEKCVAFLKVDPGADVLSKTLDQLKQHYGLTKDVVDMTEYQLRTRSNEELVVQHIPKEEIKNQVRVFKTGPDGFPDRVKNFPNSGGTEELRLDGALTLGSLSKKIEKFKIVNADRSVLAFEKSNGLVTRVDFTNGKNKLICEDQLCQCHEF